MVANPTRPYRINHKTFASLFFVAASSRAVLLSVLPLQAFRLLHDSAQGVSVLYFLVSVAGVFASLCLPALVQRLGGYRTLIVACVTMTTSALLLVVPQTPVFAAGLFVHVFAIATLDGVLSLYILQRIPRRQLTHFEPWRMVFLVSALTIGPVLGVWLETRIAHWIPFAISAIAPIITIAYFRFLGLHRMVIVAHGANPFGNLRRFMIQPRLVLAWALTLVRSLWWVMFIVYTPIYTTQSGMGELLGATIVSIGSAWTLTVPFWGWTARRYGVRWLLATGFATTGATMFLVYGFAGSPSIAIVLLIVAALGATMLDGVGHVPFFRAVRSWERPQMTSVFLTYRDASQLLAPGLFAILLASFSLPIVFAAAGTWMFGGAIMSRYIPRRM